LRREYIIAIVIVALLGGGVFAVYQFFLKERLEGYAKDQLKLEQLEKKYVELSEKFENTKPKAVIEDVANRVNPWKEAVDQRGDYFNIGDFKKIDPVPEDHLSYKLYYMEKAPKVEAAFYDYLRDEGKSNVVGTGIDLWFSAPRPDRVKDLRPDQSEVAVWLMAMQFGSSFVKMFIDADVISLRQMLLWEARIDQQVLEAYTAGVDFEMTMEDLVSFMDELRFDRDRYYDVNAIRIKNPYLMGAWANDPYLQVEMLVTTADYKEGAQVRVTSPSDALGGFGGRGGRAGAGALFASRRSGEEREKPKIPIMDRILKLFPF